ncbi:hypothetical protein [Arthrobacter sp. lap29]|uniref:hypothetical protein n=1 Tax=Arthrobacter sp. lap29 TaxID=3056122 RepID=UPI0028F74E12|nr:hypothetical protein [Arthrobacter sp. lap29]
MYKAPWSNEKLKKLGKCILKGEDAPAAVPRYDDVMVFYNDVAAETQRLIDGLDWESLLGGRRYEVTSRPKTIDTLRQKLQRDPAVGLQNIQDVAGVRFEAEMTLDEQDAVVNAIAGLFDHDPTTCVRDLRLEPHSGYRAVHIWLRLPTRVEVQVRTHLQSAWANMYESAADVYGRDIRYGELPHDPESRVFVQTVQNLSTGNIRRLETLKNTFPAGEERLNQLRAGYKNLPRGQKRRRRKSFEKEEKWFLAMIKDVGDMESELGTLMRSTQEMFDSMRSNGRN